MLSRIMQSIAPAPVSHHNQVCWLFFFFASLVRHPDSLVHAADTCPIQQDMSADNGTVDPLSPSPASPLSPPLALFLLQLRI